MKVGITSDTHDDLHNLEAALEILEAVPASSTPARWGAGTGRAAPSASST